MSEHEEVYGPPAPLDPTGKPSCQLHLSAMHLALWGASSWANSWIPGMYLGRRPDMRERYEAWCGAGKAQALALIEARKQAAREREARDATEAGALGITVAELRDRRSAAHLATLSPEEHERLEKYYACVSET